MRRAVALVGVVLVLAGCGSSGGRESDRDGSVVSGQVVLVGGTGAHAVVGLTHDNRCFGVGPNTAFAIGAPLTLQAGGHRYTVGIGPGDIVAPGDGQVVTGCRFPFTLDGVRSAGSGGTVTVAGVDRTFSGGELATPITVRVTGRPTD